MSNQSISKTVWGLVASALGFLVAATTIYVNLDIISKKLGSSVTLLGLLLLVGLFVLGVVYTIFLHRLLIRGLADLDKEREKLEEELEDKLEELEEEREELEEEREELEEIMLEQVEKLERVVERIYPAYESPSYRIVSASYVVVIEADGTLKETKTQEIAVESDSPLHFTNAWIGVDEFAPPKSNFRDIDFAARDVSGQEICYLPIENRPKKKRAVLFFLPRATREDGTRKLEVSYCWPEAMSGLLKKRGKDRWWREFDRPVSTLSFEFKIANELSPEDVEYNSMQYQEDQFQKSETVKDGYTEYLFKIDGVSEDVGDRRYTFDILTEDA